ncbi:MAG: hypothetical protein EZS28_014431 [Streblomastix strix]|uniref:Uncharacterized protein n=1 Tax=Streblomastix strix TaxID=222440 RepID=A0A5J4W535_9EUKA|nr:MAG: hypothetical protein EZS28_014431 [Streblomastix strix]
MAGVYVIIDMNMKNESAWEAHRLFAGAAVDGLGCFLNQFVSMKRRPALHFEVDTLPNLSVTRLAPFDFQHLTMQKAKVLLTPASFVDNHRESIASIFINAYKR